MPKEQISISRFEGGLNNEVDDRDIPENSLSDVNNLRVDKPGQLSLLPPADIHDAFSTSYSNSFVGEINSRYGLHGFSADRKINMSNKVITFATAESGAATRVVTSTSHFFNVGNYVRIVGSFGKAYDGYHRVKTVVDGNTFVINKTFGSSQTGQDAYAIKLPIEKEWQHNFLAIQNAANFHIFDNQALLGNQIKLQNSFGEALGGSLGTQNADDVRPSFFDVDGNLRVSDGNFKNLDNKYARWYGYIPARPIGDYQDLRGSDETGYAAFSTSGGTLSRNSGAGILVQGLDFQSTESSGSGSNITSTGNDTSSIATNRKVHVSFYLLNYSSNYSQSDKEGIGQLPAVYLATSAGVDVDGNSTDSSDATNVCSEIKIALPGLNHMIFNMQESASAVRVIFQNTDLHTYEIKHLRVTGADDGQEYLGGFEQGYYDVPATCFEPGHEEIQTGLETTNDNKNIIGYVDRAADSYSTAIDPDKVGAVYMSFQADTEDGDYFLASDHKFLRLGMSWIYDGQQESKLNPLETTFKTNSDSAKVFSVTDSPVDNSSLRITLSFASWPMNPRITGCRVYLIGYGLTSEKAEDILEDPLLLCTVDAVSSLKEGERGSVTWCDGSVSQVESVDVTTWKVEKRNLSDFPALSYKILNGYDAYDNTEARWQHGVVVNRRFYAGNVRQRVASSQDIITGTNQTAIDYQNLEDRMIKSPVNKFDILPSRNEITVANNDGMSITALRAYNGKILQFKEEALYIINVSEDFEYLEDEIHGLGVIYEDSTVNTDIGIAWTTHKGVYLYDGQKINSLTEGKIDDKTWWDFVGWDGGRIAYDQLDQVLLLYSNSSNTQYIYDIKSGSWTKGTNLIPSPNTLSTGISWHWSTGIIFVGRDQDGNSESIVEQETQAAIQPVKATGSIVFDSNSGMTSGKRLYIKDSSNTAQAVSSIIESGHALTSSLDTIHTCFGIAGLITSHTSNLPYALEARVSDIDNPFVFIKAKNAGARYNASGSASAAELEGLFFDDDGTASSASDSAGGLTSAVFTPLSGGVDGVARILRYHVNRAGSNKVGPLYMIEIDIKYPNQVDHVQETHSVLLEFAATSGNAEAIVDGLIASAEPGVDKYLTITKGGSGDNAYVQVEGNPVDSTDSNSILSKGHYYPETAMTSLSDGNISIYRWHLKEKETPESRDNVYFASRDLDWGLPSVKKKIYKIYITYKASSNTGIGVYALANGATDSNTSRNNFLDGTYYSLTNKQLLSTSGEWVTAELKVSGNNLNSVNSVKIVLDSASNVVPADFAINDISIIYRVKRVK